MRSRHWYVLGALFFRLALDLCYVTYLNSEFGDHFLTPMPINFQPHQYAFSILFLLAGAAIVPIGKSSFSGLFFFSALAFLYVPMTSIYGLNFEKSALAVGSALVALIISHVSANAGATSKITVTTNGEKRVVVISLVFVLIFSVWSLISGAAGNINLDLDKIYDNRSVNGAQLDVGVMAYINLWTQKVLNPLLLAIALYRNRRLMILFCLGMQVYFFAVTQHRAHLFTPALVYLILLLYKHNLTLARLYVITGSALVAFSVAALYFNLSEAAAIVVRRAFFVAASVTYDWVDFFDVRQKTFWSDNLLSGFMATPYTGEFLPRYLGDFFAPGKALAFNAGIVGAGYANAGLLGIAIYATLMGMILRFVNALIKNGLPVYMAAAILIAPVRTAWADSDFFTAVLSHGILIGIMMLWLYGKPTPEQPKLAARAY